MTQGTLHCRHGVLWNSECAQCITDGPDVQTPEEALQEIFDELKYIPLCDLNDRERRILTITQFHGVKL